ncbi:ABC transporter permease [uncultured Flavonifractor sp.]|uniref:ABC transporter permease n=1 Tax=uncultured Flavonifractor sp. TaxID=1193534 RepID=UPI002606AFA0|nr:FtsX-like permease family protein [uncultured Flavonifractor sp.]
MFSKLAVKNVGRSFRDYGVYFLTVAFGVCLFYVFNALETQAVIRYLARHPRSDVVGAIQRLIGVLSVFVWFVLAFLILYASRFLARRRAREMGTYLLLGMERWQVARLLLAETAVTALIALGVGLALGVALSQALSVFTAGLFAVPMTFFTFSVSLPALGKTVLAFAAIFLLVMLYHALSVSRRKLIALIQAERTNQELRVRNLGASVVLFLAGCALLGVAYAMLLTRGLLRVDALFWVMLGLGSLGTLLFFRGLSGFLLRLCQSSKRLYYKNLNLFILRQFNASINTTYRSMTVICLMLLLAIGITATSVGLNNTVEQMAREAQPQDVELIAWPEEEGDDLDLPAVLMTRGFDLSRRCARWAAFPMYEDEEGRPCLLQKDYQAYVDAWGETQAGAFLESWGARVLDGDGGTLVVQRWYFLADYAGDSQEAEDAFLQAVTDIPATGGYQYSTRLSTWMDLVGTKVLVLFIGLYLGVVFLVASAAVLALQQLSQAADSARRYRVLSRLGVSEKMRGRSVDIQVFLAFFLPLALALIHAVVGMTAANAVIAEVGRVDAAASSAVTALLLVAVYGGYFLATCWGSRRLLRSGT